MLRLSIRFRHDCPFNRIAVRYPATRIAHWFNLNTEYIEVTGAAPEELADIRRRLHRIRRRGTKVETFPTERGGTVGFAVRSRTGDSPIVDRILDRHSAIILPPVLYRNGWEEYRILVLDRGDRDGLVRELRRRGEVEVTSVTDEQPSVRLEAAYLPVRDLFGALTDRQAEAIRLAYAHGYFALPRRVGLRELAVGFGVGRSTYEEHVRKAERKVLSAALPHLEALAPPRNVAPRGRPAPEDVVSVRAPGRTGDPSSSGPGAPPRRPVRDRLRSTRAGRPRRRSRRPRPTGPG